MRTRPVPPHAPQGEGRKTADTFRLNWQGRTDSWSIPSAPKDPPLREITRAVSELLNRDQGRAFLLPSLSKACRSDLTLAQVNRNLTVAYFQEGCDSGIFKVSTEVHPAGYHPIDVSFCLNVARDPQLNNLHSAIFRNLQRLREINSKYVVEPFCLGRGALPGGRELAVFSAEWLKDYTEVNMFNRAEAIEGRPALEGLETVGLRGVRLNNPRRHSFYEGVIEDEALADEIASEMVKVLTLYFDPQAETAVWHYGINSGDFVYREGPEGKVELKLVTCRLIVKLPPCPSPMDHMRAFLLLEELFRHREDSVHYQDRADSESRVKYSIYSFTPADVCRGVKKALAEKFGAEAARQIVFNWLAAYICLDREAEKAGPAESKEMFFRRRMITEELEKFWRTEGYSFGRAVIEA